MIAALLLYCAFLLMRIEDTTTSTTTTTDPGVQIRLGGKGNPTVAVSKNGAVCENIKIPDVPQPSYGEPGRTGSYVITWGQSAMVCGGYSGSGPPFSQYKDCQILDLDTKTWSLGPKLIIDTASKEPKKVGDNFYIVGGSYPANPGPGPTVWREHSIVQALDLNNLAEGWRLLQSFETLPDDVYDQDPQYQSRNPTTVTVPSKFFPSCTTTPTTETTTPTTNFKYHNLRLGGEGDPTVTLTKNGHVCKNVKIQDVPQPSYGEPGRKGSYVITWAQSAMVCGGYTGSGPPFSQYRDCQILDLDTKTWSLGPQLINNTASREYKIQGDVFYIFGGSYPANPRPGPTEWREHNIIQALDLNNHEEGWRVVENVEKDGATGGSTTIAVDSTFFPTC